MKLHSISSVALLIPFTMAAFVSTLAPSGCAQTVNTAISQVVTDVNTLQATANDPAVIAAGNSLKAFGTAAICGGASAAALANLTSGAFKGAKAVTLGDNTRIVYVALATDCGKVGGTVAVTL